MKEPTADHPITVAPNPKRMRVTFNGRVIADTQSALALREASYPAVQYVPRQDVDMDSLVRTSRGSHCPFKGDAAYYSVRVDGREAENAVWTYEHPYPAVAQIGGYLAFYPDRVDRIEELAD